MSNQYQNMITPLYSNGDETRFIPSSQMRETPSWRSEFRRDYARVIHSKSFRRLQGKTQLFPINESDFFRNRLTHSLEVAQIAHDIALKLNAESKYLENEHCKINPQICEIAGLIHDLGHPPFGHNGEEALNECMKGYGGFEANAQTLRILLRIEKKHKPEANEYIHNEDKRLGLNLCVRTIASTLKYDNEINYESPQYISEKLPIIKGYYASEAGLVRKIKDLVLGTPNYTGSFRTLECSIMDLADDIAYCTHDLEDSLKAEFINPIDMLNMEESMKHYVLDTINTKSSFARYTESELTQAVYEIFADVLAYHQLGSDRSFNAKRKEQLKNYIQFHSNIQALMKDAYTRTEFRSKLINKFIGGIRIVDKTYEFPQLYQVEFNREAYLHIGIIKQYTHKAVIQSEKIRRVEYKGKEIIRKLFNCFVQNEGYKLLPKDFQELYAAQKHKEDCYRIISDFIAGMTNRSAIEYYARLHSLDPQSIYKP